ncbi:thiol peroxidase [Thalassotalea fusca]
MRRVKKLTTFATAVLMAVASQSPLHAKETQPETTDLVKAGNKFVTLLGTQVAQGQQAPNFRVVDEKFSPVQLSDFKNKTVLISVVPSLDTGVCSLQTKRFNEEVAQLSEELVALTISNDLPFAQKRFCQTEKIERLLVLSDSVWRDFGQNYGLLIKDMGLLTRAIFIIDKDGNIAYKELVENISNHPNYEAALASLRELASPQPSEEEIEVETAPSQDDKAQDEDDTSSK